MQTLSLSNMRELSNSKVYAEYFMQFRELSDEFYSDHEKKGRSTERSNKADKVKMFDHSLSKMRSIKKQST
jgi:hypothetical protein